MYFVNLTWYLRFIRMLQFLLVLKWCWSLWSFHITFPLMPQQVKFIWQDEWDQMQHCSAKASNNSAGTKIKSGPFQVLGIRLCQILVCKSCLEVVNCLFLIASYWAEDILIWFIIALSSIWFPQTQSNNNYFWLSD